MSNNYDLVIIGSGIAGSTLGLVLGRIGFRCLVVEKGKHPHFVIGESMVPPASYSFEYLDRMYDIPELKAVYNYAAHKAAGCTGWPKRHFWFGYNEPGKSVTPELETCLHTLLPPRGPDIHMLRADIDWYLTRALANYGVEYVDQTSVVNFDVEGQKAVLELKNAQGTSRVTADYVVDCSGHASFLAKKFGLRMEDPKMSTNSRSIFGHFRNVKFLDDVLGENPSLGFNRDGGTMHHCFDGGWIWSIRFDNGIVSVGITMDRDRWPLDESISPEEEFREIINRYPTVRSVMGDMEAVRPLIRTGRVHGGTDRIQFRCSSILGERFILTPHAASFIDPLFSTGILLTSAFIVRFAHLAKAARQDGNWSMERFRPLERIFDREVDMVDKVVGGNFKAWQHGHSAFVHYWRTWVYVAASAYMTRVAIPQEDTSVGIFGAGVPTVEEVVNRMHGAMFDPAIPGSEKAAACKRIMDVEWSGSKGPLPVDFPLVPDKTITVSNIASGAGGGSNDQFRLMRWWHGLMDRNPSVAEKVQFDRVATWIVDNKNRAALNAEREKQSRESNGTFHRAYDIIRGLEIGKVQKPFTGNPALLWEQPAEAKTAWDVHAHEGDHVTQAKKKA
jgi:FADH2 O2-dependent halogenase